MKTLHLVLKSKWYDKIASGEKTSEYRECKPYWNKRFMTDKDYHSGISPVVLDYCIAGKYDFVVFHRGYTAETMKFAVYCIQITKNKNDLNLPFCWEIQLGQRIA